MRSRSSYFSSGESCATRSSRDSISPRTESKPSSARKRRSNTARHTSATHGVCIPSTGWPPAMPLILSVALRAPGGITGTDVLRLLRTGSSLCWISARIKPICEIALTPKKGIEPVHSAVPDVDTVSVRRLGNDYCICTVRAHPSLLREPRHARESTAFLIDGPTDFYGSIHRDPCLLYTSDAADDLLC